MAVLVAVVVDRLMIAGSTSRASCTRVGSWCVGGTRRPVLGTLLLAARRPRPPLLAASLVAATCDRRRCLAIASHSTAAPADDRPSVSPVSIPSPIEGGVFDFGLFGQAYAERDNLPWGSRAGTGAQVRSGTAPTASPTIGIRRPLAPNAVVAPPGTEHEQRCVVLDNCPPSILPEEIQAIGATAAPHVQSVERLHGATAEFQGKVLVTLDSPVAAQEFARATHRTLVSGRSLRTEVLALGTAKQIVCPTDPNAPLINRYNPLARTSLFASFLISRYSGRVVLFSGLPQRNLMSTAVMLWHGGWSLEPSMRNTEWNVCLTRLFFHFHQLRYESLLQGQNDSSHLSALVWQSRDSGARARGIPLLSQPTPQGLIDAGRLDPIFPLNVYVCLTLPLSFVEILIRAGALLG